MSGENVKRPFDRLDTLDRLRIRVTLAAVWAHGMFSGSDNVAQTWRLAEDNLARLLLGEFSVETLKLSDFDQRVTEEVVKNIEFNDRNISEFSFEDYVANQAAAAFLAKRRSFPIKFAGSSKEVFADAVVGTTSFIIEGTGTVVDEETTNISVSIRHATGFDLFNELHLTVLLRIGEIFGLPEFSELRRVDDFLEAIGLPPDFDVGAGSFEPDEPVPGMSEPVTKIEGAIVRKFSIKFGDKASSASFAPETAVEQQDAIQSQIDILVPNSQLFWDFLIRQGGQKTDPLVAPPPRRKPAPPPGFSSSTPTGEEQERSDAGAPIDTAEDNSPEALLEDLPQALTEWFDTSGARFEPALRLDAADGPGEPADPDTTIDLLAKYGVWLTNPDGTGIFLTLPRFNANHDVVDFEAVINAKGELLEIDGLEVTNRPMAGTRSRMDLVRNPSVRNGADAPPDRGQQSPQPKSGQSRSRSGLMPGGAGEQRGTSPDTSPQPSGDQTAAPEPGAKPGAATAEPSFLLPGS